jgi:hypothetical protein
VEGIWYPLGVKAVVTPSAATLTAGQKSALTTAVEVAIRAFVESLGVGSTVVYNRLVAAIIAVDGVYDVSLDVFPAGGEPSGRRSLTPTPATTRPRLYNLDVTLRGALIALVVAAQIDRKGLAATADPAQALEDARTDILNRLQTCRSPPTSRSAKRRCSEPCPTRTPTPSRISPTRPSSWTRASASLRPTRRSSRATTRSRGSAPSTSPSRCRPREMSPSARTRTILERFPAHLQADDPGKLFLDVVDALSGELDVKSSQLGRTRRAHALGDADETTDLRLLAALHGLRDGDFALLRIRLAALAPVTSYDGELELLRRSIASAPGCTATETARWGRCSARPQSRFCSRSDAWSTPRIATGTSRSAATCCRRLRASRPPTTSSRSRRTRSSRRRSTRSTGTTRTSSASRAAGSSLSP